MAKSPKQKAWEWCSRYIRLRDAIAFCKKREIDLMQFNRVEDISVQCCTCSNIYSWIYGDAGHFISRGSRGLSGVYFDERNIHFQCKPCNGFHQGMALEYEEFMLKEYGREVIDQLGVMDITNSYKGKIWAIQEYYKDQYKLLVKQAGF